MLKMLITSILLGISATAFCSDPPASKKNPVKDIYFHTEVIDDYRWLENWNDPEVKKWSDTQNLYARSILDQLPGAAKIRSRITGILSAETTKYGAVQFKNGKLFALKLQPPKQQPFLILLDSPEKTDNARILVDPNSIDAKGTTAIDWYVPSPDGRFVAVSLSKGGTESGDVSVYEIATGKIVFETIPRVNGGTAGGDLDWAPDSAGFYYTRYPRGNERPAADIDFYQQLYYHKLGTPTEQDRYELGKELPRIAEIKTDMNAATGCLLATVQKGDGGEFLHFLRTPDGQWKQIANYEDKVVQISFGVNNDLYLLSLLNAPRGQVLRLDINTPELSKAKILIPQNKDAVYYDFVAAKSIAATPSRIYVIYQLGGPSEIRVFDHQGKQLDTPKQIPIASTEGIVCLDNDAILFNQYSYTNAPAYYAYSPKNPAPQKTALFTNSPVDFSDIEVIREFAISKDGTKIPVNILMPKNCKRDGANPGIVNGYGGYGINYSPRFNPVLRVPLEHGMVYAVANLRGGGEYGEEWHLQGNLTRKQNVFDDFYAVIRLMVDRGYIAKEKLAIIGGSNGGLLMGATFTQHPELLKAVVSSVGIYDMLRVELSSNGSFNIPEFGTVKIEEQFNAMYAYSPYHHVVDKTKYPAILFLTGANDPRVDPLQSRKMTARLQAATASGEPVLLRTSAQTGHGGSTGLNNQIEEYVDIYSFFFDRLGVTIK